MSFFSALHILISTTTYGTYSFDIATSAWTKSGDWRLPFRGRAEHVPEHGLWLGISAIDDTILSAWNLSSVPEVDGEPPVEGVLCGQSRKRIICHYSWGLAHHRLLTRSLARLGQGPLTLRRICPGPSSESPTCSSESYSSLFILRNKSTLTNLNIRHVSKTIGER